MKNFLLKSKHPLQKSAFHILQRTTSMLSFSYLWIIIIIFKSNGYSFSQQEVKEWKRKIQRLQEHIDNFIEKAGILKKCRKCGLEFPARRDKL